MPTRLPKLPRKPISAFTYPCQEGNVSTKTGKASSPAPARAAQSRRIKRKTRSRFIAVINSVSGRRPPGRYANKCKTPNHPPVNITGNHDSPEIAGDADICMLTTPSKSANLPGERGARRRTLGGPVGATPHPVAPYRSRTPPRHNQDSRRSERIHGTSGPHRKCGGRLPPIGIITPAPGGCNQ